MRSFILAVIFATSCGWHARSSEIRIVPAGQHKLVFIEGDIVSGDYLDVRVALAEVEFPVVLLKSPGGDVVEAMKIGRLLRAHGAATGVAPNFVCTSACAIIWAAGVQRYMAPTSLVGFHAAYTIDGRGEAHVSGWANALVGAYLSELNIGGDAIVFMTSAGPSSVNWINLSIANEIGLQVFVLSDDGLHIERSVEEKAQSREEVALKLPRGYRWIVIQSRESSDEIDPSWWAARTGFYVSMVDTRSGYAAAVIGPFSESEARETMERLSRDGIIPGDAYLSSGNGFITKLW